MSQFEDKLLELSRQVENFCRHDPIHEASQLSVSRVSEYNHWLEVESRKLAAEKSKLECEIGEVRKMEEALQQSAQDLAAGAPSDGEAGPVEAHNQRVLAHNQKASELRNRAEQYRVHEKTYNELVARLNTEAESRRQAVDQVQKEARTRADAHRNWVQAHGPEELGRSVNALLAALCVEKRKGQGNPMELELWLSRVRKLRDEIGLRAMQQQAQQQDGMLMIQATISGGAGSASEECRLLVDNAASLSVLTPELVEALGLGEFKGEDVELNLPNGIRINAPQLVIPAITCNGQTSEFVKAVILKESTPGVDGALGLSFLSRFNFSIHKGRPQRLSLEPLALSESQSQFDVFVCHKSQDLEPAHAVYDVLARSGFRPFLSEESLNEVASGDYHREIDLAIEGARDLVVVCSSRENLMSSWVEAEWRRFECLILSGRKTGRIVPVLCGSMTVNDLPPALFRYSAVIMAEGSGWEARLLNTLRRR